MKYFLHRLLFVCLIFPLGLFLSFEVCFRFVIAIIIWVITGASIDDFMENVYIYKLIEFLKFDKYLNK